MGPSDSSALACATLPWVDGSGQLRVAVLVKATFALRRGALAEVIAPLPIAGDLPRDPTRPSSLIAASDRVPLKAHAEVTLVGRVHPQAAGAPRQVVGLAVARGATVLVQRRLVAVGPRERAGAPVADLPSFPADHEHTVGGPTSEDNPVGWSHDDAAPSERATGPRREIGASPARLVDPQAPGRPAAFGPIAPDWGPRARRLSPGHADLLRADPLLLPGDFDLRFFQSAPPEQWLSAPLRGGERILLVGLWPDAHAVVCRLPALHAFAQIDGPGAHRRPVPLAGDTLWIDAEQRLATVTYRGSVAIEKPHARAAMEPGAFLVRAGLAPCEGVEECLAEPRAWSFFTPRTERAPGPSVDPITLENDSGLAAATLAWMADPRTARRTVIVKGTFDVPPDGGRVTLADEQEPLHGDVFADGARDAKSKGEGDPVEIERASDFAPLKLEADVLLRGTAHAAEGHASALVTLTVGSLRARVVALAPRAWGKDGVPRATGPFAPVPLRWAHALGGPGHAANPAGTGVIEGSPPPLLEDPDRLMRTRADRPHPAAFAPIAPSWPLRRALTGTFDAAWQRDRWPCFPANFDPAYHQAAPPPLRCPPLAGDETFRAESVRPGGGAVDGTLAGVRPRAFVQRGSAIVEVPLKLDTFVLDADAMRVSLVWRGAFDPGDSPARVTVLRDDLRAPRSFEDIAALLCARRATGLDDRSVKPPSAPSYALADITNARPQGRSRRIAAAGLAVAIAAGAGVFKASLAGPAARPAPPPPTRAEVLALLAANKDLRAIDLSCADLSGLDLSGRDLHGALLAGADLTNARLAGANLTGANLAGIHAPRCCFDAADLSRADLTSADLSSASLLRVKLDRTKLAEATLDDARLDGAEGEGASFVKASLARAHLTCAKLPKADLSKARAAKIILEKATIDDAKLLDLEAPGAVLDGASLVDARLEGAALAGASFVGAMAKGAVLEQADLTESRFSKADLTSAILAGADLSRADLRGVLAQGAVLRKANLSGARLDGADLMRATFEGADLRRATFVGASLYQAETWLATTDHADLTGAHVAGTKLAARAK